MDDKDGLALQASVGELVTAMEDVFGRLLTAHIAGVDEPKVLDDWASGRAAPRDEIVQRARTALHIAELLMTVERPSVVRAWFGGQHQVLGDRRPALVLSTDPDAVWRAARVFRGYGQCPMDDAHVPTFEAKSIDRQDFVFCDFLLVFIFRSTHC